MKIFGIGLSKTGTTSLASALGILGFKTWDYPGLTTYTPGDLASIDPDVYKRQVYQVAADQASGGMR